jgi:hypothetical protein
MPDISGYLVLGYPVSSVKQFIPHQQGQKTLKIRRRVPSSAHDQPPLDILRGLTEKTGFTDLWKGEWSWGRLKNKN